MICASGASWASWAYWASWWGGRRGRQQSDWRAVWRAEREACRRASCHPTAAFRTETCAFVCSERGSALAFLIWNFVFWDFFFRTNMPKIVYIFFVIFSREFASSRVRGFASSRVREFAGGVREFAGSRVEFAGSRVRGWSSRVSEFAGGVREFAGSRVEFASSRVRGWRSKFYRLPRNSADLHADARTR
jgi:hypothetical protein